MIKICLIQFPIAENCEYLVDYIMPEETAIVGDAKGSFLFRRRDETKNYSGDLFFFDAAALVFARDQNKSDGTYSFIFVSKALNLL